MPDHAVLLVGLDIRIAHALEVIVGGIELAHVREAKEVVLALATPTLGRAVLAGRLAAAPLTDGAALIHALIVGRLHADAIEVFRVEFHCL